MAPKKTPYKIRTLSSLLMNELTLISDRLRNFDFGPAQSEEELEYIQFMSSLLKENQEKIKKKMNSQIKTVKQINRKLKFIH